MAYGDFELLCHRANIPLCPLVGPYDGTVTAFGQGVLPRCYARSIDLANTLVFNVGNVFLQFGTFVVLAIIVYNSYQKYTAVGRREMLDVFYLYTFLTLWSLIIDSGVVAADAGAYPWFVAVQMGLAGAVCIQLLCTSLIGFQFWEDGIAASVWGIRALAAAWGAGNFITAILTFKSWGGLDPKHTVALMTVDYTVNAVFLFFYVCVMLYITAVLLREWWAFGAVLLGVFFFVAGQVLMYAFGYQICDSVKHYVDGIFFATVCNMFAMLMVYKAWDITTSEDLEFVVSSTEGGWDLKSALAGDDVYGDYHSEYAMSHYTMPVAPV